MAGNFERATKFFTSRGRLEKQKQQNEYSNKGKKHINRSYTYEVWLKRNGTIELRSLFRYISYNAHFV